MKQLTWKLIIPLTVISFSTFTKWWYTLPVDAPETLAYGFPIPFVSYASHTSMSLQIFLLELFIDFLVYFLLWFVLVSSFRKFYIEKRIYNIIPIGLWTGAGIILVHFIWISLRKENNVYLKRPYDMEVLETGYIFFGYK